VVLMMVVLARAPPLAVGFHPDAWNRLAPAFPML
jgi:hypothetical protein